MGSGLISWSLTLFLLFVLLFAQDSRARKIAQVEEEAQAFDHDNDGDDASQWIHGNRDDDDADVHLVISMHHNHDDPDDHDTLHEIHTTNSYTDPHESISKHHDDDEDKSSYMDHHHVDSSHMHNHDHDHRHLNDPSLNIFFTMKDLKVGKTMPVYFSDNYNKEPSISPKLLSRQESNSIPFASSKLPFLLKFFSFLKDSPQTKAIKYTLQQCELKPTKGETKFCATSLESMLDFLRGIFGLDTSFKVLTTKILTNKHTTLQNYTVLEPPKEIFAPKMIACHTMPYPYVVFYCHGHGSENKLFQVLLSGENGEIVKAPAVCHVDTSQWDPDHVSFRILKIRPGTSSVCHFFPTDNLVWVPN